MAKQGSRGSITQQKKRYNDNFAIYTIGNKYVQSDFGGANVFSDLTDWALSFFVNRLNNGSVSVFWDNRGGIANSTEGIEILFDNVTGGYNFRLRTGTEVAFQIDYYFNLYKFQFNYIYHVVLNYDSISRSLNLYVNSVLVQSINISTNTIDCTNVAYNRLFSLFQSLTTTFQGFCRDFAVFNKQLIQNEIAYIYQTGVLPPSTHESCQLHLPLNSTPVYDANNIMRSKGGLGMINFNKSLSDGDEIETTVIDITYSSGNNNNGVGVGFRTSTGGNLNDYYSIYIKNGFYKIESNASVGLETSIVPQANDVIKAKINGNFIEFYVNNTLVPFAIDYTILSNISNLKAYILAFNSYSKALQNTKYNNVLLKHTDVLEEYNSTFGDRLQYDVVSNYNYAKLTPIVPSHALMAGWTDNELGLNTGTSTFTAYGDFYTKNLGENFSGGGDSIIYKGKELRKYGLSFNGIDQYLQHPNFNATKESGYTVIAFYANKTNSIWGSTQSIFSKYGSDGDTRQFDLRTVSTDERVNLLVPLAGGGTLSLSSFQTGVDNSKLQMASYVISTIQDVPMPYEKLGSSKYYGYQTYNTVNDYVNQLNTIAGVGFGFDEITAGTTRIGQKNGSNFFDGNLACLMVFKGTADQEFIKRRYNNGLINLPSDYELDSNGLEFVLCPDFNNPFDDAGTLKIPDLITAEDWIAFNYTDLSTLQASRFEIKSLM